LCGGDLACRKDGHESPIKKVMKEIKGRKFFSKSFSQHDH